MESVFSWFVLQTIRILSSSNALRLYVGFWGYPKGSALELLDGTLKLRHCTEVFTMRFPPSSLPRVGYGSGKRDFVTPGHLPDAGWYCGQEGPAYQKDTSKCYFSFHSGSWASNAEEMEKIGPPRASLATFFLDLGFGDYLHLVTPGTCSRRLQA